jgi:hypothetical protein
MKGMKTKDELLFGFAGLFLAAIFSLTVTACVSTAPTEIAATVTVAGMNNGRFGENIRVPVKDFETKGLVFTETQLITADKGNDEGQIFTYQALLKEAQKLGADAIINVVIDQKIQVSTSPNKRYTTWYGSALAIKYTATLKETASVTVTENDVTTTTSTTSVYFNEDAADENSVTAVKPSAKTKTPARASSNSNAGGGILGLRQ